VARRRGSRKLAGLVSISNKEIVDVVLLGVAGATVSTSTIATTVNDYVGTVGTCPLGAIIKGFELMVSYGVSTVPARFDWYLAKNVANSIGGNLPVPGASGGSSTRRFIIHEEKGLAPPTQDGNRLTKLHINIPKRYWRMGEADIWSLKSGSSTGGTYDVCIKAIYKWKL